MLLTIGDSHSYIPFRTIARTRYMGAITMKRLGNPAEPLLHQCAAELAPQPGDVLIDALDLEDWVFGINITPNRGDELSVIGIARELSAIFGAELKLPGNPIRETATPVEDVLTAGLDRAAMDRGFRRP